MSQFIMLDQFVKVLGVAEHYPGVVVPRKIIQLDISKRAIVVSLSPSSIRPFSQSLDDINPPSKVL